MPVGTDQHCETLGAIGRLEPAACILIHGHSEWLRRRYTGLDDRRRSQEAGQAGLCAELGQIRKLRAIFCGRAIRDQHVFDPAQHVARRKLMRKRDDQRGSLKTAFSGKSSAAAV
jgi:hypothetical protein